LEQLSINIEQIVALAKGSKSDFVIRGKYQSKIYRQQLQGNSHVFSD